MPAGYTHYCFGKDVYKHLDDQNIKDLLLRNENCFLIYWLCHRCTYYHLGEILTSEISNINKNSIEKFEKIRQNKNIDKIILQTRRTK